MALMVTPLSWVAVFPKASAAMTFQVTRPSRGTETAVVTAHVPPPAGPLMDADPDPPSPEACHWTAAVAMPDGSLRSALKVTVHPLSAPTVVGLALKLERLGACVSGVGVGEGT